MESEIEGSHGSEQKYNTRFLTFIGRTTEGKVTKLGFWRGQCPGVGAAPEVDDPDLGENISTQRARARTLNTGVRMRATEARVVLSSAEAAGCACAVIRREFRK